MCKWVSDEVGEDWDGSNETVGWGDVSVESAGRGVSLIPAASEERRGEAAFGGAPVVQRCSDNVREEEGSVGAIFRRGFWERESGRGFE